MAKIQELLDNLLHKKLGRDVRQSIHDSIEQCYKDATGHPESVAGVIEENKNLKQAMAKQDARINNLAKLPGGSTAGDAELADIRVGADGETYDTAGQAVREQISSLKSDTSRIKKNLRTTYVDMNLFALGTINKDTGEEESSNKILRSIIDVNATEDITIKLPKGYQWNVAHWLAGKYRSDLWNENYWNQNLTIGKTTMNYKYRILIRRSDGADITLSELIGVAETNREDLQSFDKIDDLKKNINEVDKKVDNLSIETDATLTQSGKPADAKVTGDAIKKVKEDMEKIDLSNNISPNLFNPAVAKANVAISSDDGSEMNGFSGWEATDYIFVSKNDVLYFSSNGKPTPYSTGAFYDAQKKFTSGFGNPNNNNNIAVTSDGYARFSFDSKKEKLQIEKGSRTTYIPYGELKVKADVDNVKEDTGNIKAEVSEVKVEVAKIQEDHTNIFNKDTVVKGAVFPDSGYFDTSFSSWETSDYIPVKPGMVLYFSSNELPIGVASTGAYFDKDKKYLSQLKDEPLSITIPDGAYFIRFSKNGGLGNTLNTLKIEQHGITKFTPYGELYVTVNESALPSSILPKWKGLKILTLGDSITAMGGVNGWTYWIKQYLIADKVVNVSVAGSTWQDKVANQTYDGNPQPSTDGNVMGNQVQKVLNAKANGDADYQDFDVITFSFGTNDSVDFSVQTKESVESQFITNYAQNNFTVVPIDNVNRQTLAGAMRYGFQKLHEAYPNAVIFMCTPTQECYETFDSIYQKGDFINFVADRLGAETIDTRRCGIRNIYESQTTIDYDHPEQSGVAPIQTDLLDGIHTNENGAKKIAKYNAREIMKYCKINIFQN